MTEYEKKLIEDNMNAVAMTTWQFLKQHNISRSEFDDYCQNGYLILCNKVHKYDGSTKFSTFIDVVLRNAFIDMYRTDKNRRLDVVSLNEYLSEEKTFNDAQLAAILEGDNTTENEVLEKVTNEIMKKCIKRAKSKCTSKTTVRGFEALELRIEGYSGAQISEMMKTPSNSIRVGINRAKKILLDDKEFVDVLQTV